MSCALAAGSPIAVVIRRKVRDFVRPSCRLAKTDALDAAVLIHFAEAVKPALRPLPDAQTQALAALLSRRQVIEMLVAEPTRLHTAQPLAQPRVATHIAWLEQELAAIDEELRDIIEQIDSSPQLALQF